MKNCLVLYILPLNHVSVKLNSSAGSETSCGRARKLFRAPTDGNLEDRSKVLESYRIVINYCIIINVIVNAYYN